MSTPERDVLRRAGEASVLVLVSLAGGCLLGFSAALLAETAPAKAAGTTQSPSGPVPPGAGSPHQATPCRPVPPSHVGAIPAAGHPQPSIHGAAHARSC
jgi:hypothetical protein